MFALRALKTSAHVLLKVFGDGAEVVICDGRIFTTFEVGPEVLDDHFVLGLRAIRAAAKLARERFAGDAVFTLAKGRLTAKFKPGVAVPDEAFQHCDSVEQET